MKTASESLYDLSAQRAADRKVLKTALRMYGRSMETSKMPRLVGVMAIAAIAGRIAYNRQKGRDNAFLI